MRLENVLSTFADFDAEDLALAPQQFEDFKGKYLDLHDVAKKRDAKEKASILDDVDFKLSLLHRDEINDALNQKPRILERKGALARIGERITQFIETFVDGMGGSV